MIHSGTVSAADGLERWREVLGRLRRGPAPRGETFDLCRRVLDAAPAAPEAVEAARVLLEGAMADAATPTADAQDVMAMLKAAAGGSLNLQDVIVSS